MARSNLRNIASRLKWLFPALLVPAAALAVVHVDYLVTPKADAGNVRVTGDTISTTDANGDLSISPNGTGKLLYTPATASTVPYFDASKKLTSSAVTPTELGYVSGVTSSLCGINQSCAITNKTIDGASNTLSHVPLGTATGTLQATNFPALTGDITTSAGSLATTLASTISGVKLFSSGIQVGTAVGFAGASSGLLTMNVPATFTSFNLNLPVTAGSSGNVLTSGGGGASAMTWTALAASATTDTTNASNISSGTLGAARLPNPSASTLGGVESLAAVSHNFLTSISTSGVPAQAQPAFTDISGSVAASQMPALTGDVTTSAGAVATTIASGVVSNAKLATMAAHSYKGNNTGSTAAPLDLTATQLTAELNAMVGDSGSGGTKGLVPAPASGDAAAAKFLKADGTWAAPAGAGTVTSVGLTMPTGFSVSGSPVTGSGTLAVTLPNRPILYANRTSAQSIASSTSTKIQFNNVSVDSNSNWDGTNFRFTPTVNGTYLAICSTKFDSSVNTAIAEAQIFKNGSVISYNEIHASTTKAIGGPTAIITGLNGSTDYLECDGYQDSGGSVNVSDGVGNYFLVLRIF